MPSVPQKNSLIVNSDTQQAIEQHRSEGWENLDHERLLFAVTYIECNYCHLTAAKELDWSKSVALRYLRDPIVGAYLRDYSAKVAETAHVTEDFIRSKLLELLPKFAGQEEVHVFVPQMAESVAVRKFHGPEYLRTLDSLAKHIGFHDPADDGTSTDISAWLRRAMERRMEAQTIDVTPEDDSTG